MLPFHCNETGSKGRVFMLLFSTIPFSRRLNTKSPTVQIQNISIFSAVITFHHPHHLKIPCFPSLSQTTSLLEGNKSLESFSFLHLHFPLINYIQGVGRWEMKKIKFRPQIIILVPQMALTSTNW